LFVKFADSSLILLRFANKAIKAEEIWHSASGSWSCK